MGRTKRFLLHKQEETESSFEVDLAPMLALMVTLIPIMLLSTVFVRITLIETPLPQVVQKAIEEDRNKKDREVTITLDMNEGGFVLQSQIDGSVKRNYRLPKINNQWDLQGLYQQAHQLKLENPNVFRVDFKPSSNVSYKDIVKVMDELRTIKKEDTQVELLDKDTQQKAKTNVMFPDVNFANVVEG